nr:MAG TPA: hypothetical protein [Caudoviricetes sp.]
MNSWEKYPLIQVNTTAGLMARPGKHQPLRVF